MMTSLSLHCKWLTPVVERRQVEVTTLSQNGTRTFDISEHRGGSPNVLVILRTHEPRPVMLERWRSFQKDLTAIMPQSVFMVSLDVSNLRDPLGIVKNITSAVPGVRMHIYDWAAVQDTYWKGFQGIRRRYSRRRFSRPQKLLLSPFIAFDMVEPGGWNWHTEPTLLAVKHARQRGFNGKEDVWVIEDDVGLCGKLPDLVRAYVGNPADFLVFDTASSVGHASSHFIDEGSDAFLDRYATGQRWHARENVLRFSSRFLHFLHFAMIDGVTAHSEILVVTICKNEGFDCALASKEHLFADRFGWDTRVTPDEWYQLCPPGSHLETPKLAHGLKF